MVDNHIPGKFVLAQLLKLLEQNLVYVVILCALVFDER